MKTKLILATSITFILITFISCIKTHSCECAFIYPNGDTKHESFPFKAIGTVNYKIKKCDKKAVEKQVDKTYTQHVCDIH